MEKYGKNTYFSQQAVMSGLEVVKWRSVKGHKYADLASDTISKSG